MNSRPWILPLALLLALAVPLLASAEEPSREGLDYFEKHIRPLFAERCYACHSQRADDVGGSLLLDSRPGWLTGGTRGPAIVPGDVEASLLIQAVRYVDPDLQMPPDRQLSSDEIAYLEEWVRQGAPDPRSDASLPDKTIPAASDPVAGRTHWAFQSLSKPAIPEVNDSNWPRTHIDAFVMAKLESQRMYPNDDADPRVLARRIYFQLLGLPPTIEQVEAFANDHRPDALERLVDQLLNSPQFGERWGRHWLDLARYADSNGLDENFLFREAWRYRNWVIDAVNDDVPFDRFLLQQIAGDLLPYDSIEQRDRQRIASGFLVIGPKVLLGNDPANQKMEVADEQLDTIGRAVLGQTLGCARCHDHKFDPIPTADYYALAGIMTSTDVMEKRYMLGEQRVMERLVGLGADGHARDEAYEEYWRNVPKLKNRHKQAQTALELLEKGDAEAFQKLLEEHKEAVNDQAADASVPLEQRLEAQRSFIAELQSSVAAPPSIPPRAMIAADVDSPADESIRIAGQFNRPGEKVPRGFLQVLSDSPALIADDQSGRIELARWLTDVHSGAGRLTARVLANRVWHHMMGRGIVRTVDNFGRTGEEPSHPELLDFLAHRLIESGWSVKALVRDIALSRSFALSSQHNDVCHAVDPDNVLLWRAHRRRLEPEAIRDAMLVAAGELDLRPMDSTVWYLDDQATAVGDNKNRRRTDFPCRSVYLPVIRNDLPEIFEAFDFANPHATTGLRPRTMMATQSLFLLNDQLVMQAARGTAERLLRCSEFDDGPQAVDQIFKWIIGRPATETDTEALLAFVRDVQGQLASENGENARLRAWSLACHALFASSRFQILE